MAQATEHKKTPAALNNQTKKKPKAKESQWFVVLSQMWPPGPSSEGLQRLRLPRGSRALPAFGKTFPYFCGQDTRRTQLTMPLSPLQTQQRGEERDSPQDTGEPGYSPLPPNQTTAGASKEREALTCWLAIVWYHQNSLVVM